MNGQTDKVQEEREELNDLLTEALTGSRYDRPDQAAGRHIDWETVVDVLGAEGREKLMDLAEGYGLGYALKRARLFPGMVIPSRARLGRVIKRAWGSESPVADLAEGQAWRRRAA